MFVTLLAVVISAQPAPAGEIQYRSYDVATALKRGCKIQRVYVAGRTEHAPIIRCPAQQSATDGEDSRRSRG